MTTFACPSVWGLGAVAELWQTSLPRSRTLTAHSVSCRSVHQCDPLLTNAAPRPITESVAKLVCVCGEWNQKSASIETTYRSTPCICIFSNWRSDCQPFCPNELTLISCSSVSTQRWQLMVVVLRRKDKKEIHVNTTECTPWRLTSWSWVLLEENPPVVQLLKNLPIFYKIRRFITELTRALHCFLFWAWSLQSTPTHPICLWTILILSTHLRFWSYWWDHSFWLSHQYFETRSSWKT
jgi:hypothetical protein